MSSISMQRTLTLVVAGALLLAAGCSSSNQQTGFNSTTGKHIENWYVDHRVAFLQNPQACSGCHGTDLKGGISGVSCFSADFSGLSCHANGPSGHPTGWANPDSHGASAKAAPNPATTSGFSTCQICHGGDFAGGLALKTCLNTAGCHGNGVYAPHPAKPWRGARTHATTDPGNAPVCALCHTNGANSSVQPAPFDPAAAPGCFNNTLCHGAAGHPAGWALPSAHGTTAKAAPTAASGFSLCQTCHGSDFTGGTALKTCLDTAGCHGASVNAPHAFPWVPGSTYVHTTTDEGNAPVCALCHLGGRTPPSYATVPAGTPVGCFDNSLCHGVRHPAGWADPLLHGASAKSAPTSTSGFSLCQTCHGNDFAGAAPAPTCLNTAGCHGAGVNSPHSPKPWRGGARTHTNTHPGNAPVCFTCHADGALSSTQPATPPQPGALPGCFNNTLCHAQVAAPHAVPFTNAALHGPAAKPDLTYCQGCHADQPAGGAGSNPRFNVAIGSLATGCEGASCHATNMAHPTPWRGLVPNDTGHMTAGNMANACALCHGVNLAGGVGPACVTCHKLGSPLTMTNCTSCHGKPPTGSVAPNRAGAHVKHNNLANVTNICNSCHNNAGTGTAKHFNTVADVVFLSVYQAQSGGTATFNAAANTCTNVSCHGGQTTPSWLTGTINVNTQCTSCHAYNVLQYNTFKSGEHNLHVNNQGFACTECHDTTKLAAVHFTGLNTTAMTTAYQTLLSTLNYTGTGSGSGTCTINCHGEQHSSRSW